MFRHLTSQLDGFSFPLILPFLFGGGVGKLKSLTMPENIALMCNWPSLLRETGDPVGFSRVDFEETMTLYEAAGSLLQRLDAQLQHKRRCFVSWSIHHGCWPGPLGTAQVRLILGLQTLYQDHKFKTMPFNLILPWISLQHIGFSEKSVIMTLYKIYTTLLRITAGLRKFLRCFLGLLINVSH